MSTLSVENVSKIYPGHSADDEPVLALDDVSFRVEDHEFWPPSVELHTSLPGIGSRSSHFNARNLAQKFLHQLPHLFNVFYD